MRNPVAPVPPRDPPDEPRKPPDVARFKRSCRQGGRRTEVKTKYDQWKGGKAGFDNYVGLVSKYAGERKISLELLESLVITDDTVAQKACNALIQWHKAGYSQQMIDKQARPI